jgi:hypothetical protein
LIAAAGRESVPGFSPEVLRFRRAHTDPVTTVAALALTK